MLARVSIAVKKTLYPKSTWGKKGLFHHLEKSEQELKTGNEAEALED